MPANNGSEENITVIVRVRPFSEVELEARCRVVTNRAPGEPQIILGQNKNFTFDQVYFMESEQDQIFHGAVQQLIDGSLEGRNATILAYGQTGSGKTYTMGTGFDVDLPADAEGIVPRAVRYLFTRIEQFKSQALAAGTTMPEFSVSISFLELYRGEFYDLFTNTPGKQASNIKILDERNDDGVLNIHISGVTRTEVASLEEVMSHLRRGSLERVTASTDMNQQSSRSHAVFTMYITHTRTIKQEIVGGLDSESTETTVINDVVTTSAKFNFVDLAGSERLKRTHATGDRAKEGIDINSGLLALGNVISALGDPTQHAQHVPYRSSKLTRILQDSLGGNSKTVMIACVSPADRDMLETLNTLKYANRARNIKNKVVVNKDSASQQIALLQDTVQKLRLELMQYKQGKRMVGDNASTEDVNLNDMFIEIEHLREECGALKKKNEILKNENATLFDQAYQLQFVGAKRQESETVQNPDDISAQVFLADPNKRMEELFRENIQLKSQLSLLTGTPASRPPTSVAETLRTATRASALASSTPSRPATSNELISETISRIQRGRAVLETVNATSTKSIGQDEEEDIEDDSDSDNDVDAVSQGSDQVLSPSLIESRFRAGLGADQTADVPTGIDTSDDQISTEIGEKHEQLLTELSQQIEIEEKLLAELQTKESELVKQRELYEQKLIQERKEKDAISKQRDQIMRDLSALQSKKEDADSKKIRSAYEQQLKSLQTKISSMEAESKRREREMAEHQQRMDKINLLQKSLEEAKAQRRKLMEETKDVLSKNKELDDRRTKEIAKLKLEGNKKDAEFKKWKDDASSKALLLARSEQENIRLKEELSKLRQATKESAKDTATSRFSTRPATAVDVPKQSKSALRTAVKCKMGLLQNEITRAIVYAETKAEMQGLMEKRDVQLLQERNKLLTEKRLLAAKPAPDLAKLQEIDEELERVDTETDLQSEAIQSRQEEILAMETAGMRSFASVDELSEEGLRTVKSTTIDEARLLIKEVLVGLVKQHVETDAHRVKVKEIEAELKKKDALLKAFLSKGASISDISPPVMSDTRVPIDTREELFRVMQAPTTSATAPPRISSAPASAAIIKPSPKLGVKPRTVFFGSPAATPEPVKVSPNASDFLSSLRKSEKTAPAKPVEPDGKFIPEKSKRSIGRVLQCTHTALAHEDEVLCLAPCSPVMLASGSKDAKIKIWDLNQLSMSLCLSEHDYHVKSLAYGNGSLLSCSKNIIKIWDLRSRNSIKTLKLSKDIQSLLMDSSSNCFLTASGKTVKMWDMRNYQQVKSFSSTQKIVCMCLAGSTDIAVAGIDRSIRMFHTKDSEAAPPTLLEPPHYDTIHCLTGSDGLVISGSRDYSIKQWRRGGAGKWDSNSITAAHGAFVSAISLVSGTPWFISGSSKGAVKLWDVDSGTAIDEMNEHTNSVNDFAVIGDQIFSASNDRTIKIWKYSIPVAPARSSSRIPMRATETARAPPVPERPQLTPISEHPPIPSRPSPHMLDHHGDSDADLLEYESSPTFN